MNSPHIRSLLTLILLTLAAATLRAASDDGRKSVISITAYGPQDELLHSGNGFFIGPQGEALAEYDLFRGATRAVAIDAAGKRYNVSRILGASETYNMVRFRVDTKKNDYLEPAATAGTKDTDVSIIPYSVDKKSQPQTTRIADVTTFGSYRYYTLDAANDAPLAGCPVVDAGGRVIALAQKNVTKNAAGLCAIDVQAGRALTVGTLSYMNRDLKAIKIPTALPEGESDALNYIYMLGMTKSDSAASLTAYADFIAAYPQNADVYLERAKFYAAHADYARSEADIRYAIDHFKDKAGEAHYTLSKLIYDKVIGAPKDTYDGWTLENALAEAEQAINDEAHPLYRAQAGQCRFALKQYEQAYEDFLAVTKTELASSEMFYYAARSLEMAGGDSLRILTLADSAVGRCTLPYTAQAAPFFLARADYRTRYGRYREAAADYREYETIMGSRNLNANFYYLREQAELGGRMYQQALDDIDKAITLAPDEPLYRLERAVIQLRVGNFEEALQAAQTAGRMAPDSADAQRLAALALEQLGRKAEAAEAMKKAKELGADDEDTNTDVSTR